MPKKPPKLNGRKRDKKGQQRQQVSSKFRLLNTPRTFTQEEFQDLLEKLNFTPRIIEAYRKASMGLLQYIPSSDPLYLKAEENFQCDRDFIEKYLANWLFEATELLLFQAPFACGVSPISRAELSNLILHVFVDQGPPTNRLKHGRKQIWDRITLLWVLGKVLPEINSTGTLTLATVAKKINAFARETGRLGKMGMPLTEKHLQKLFMEHDIDWKRIKEDHKEHLGFKKTHSIVD
jgi:hypothetical protein